MPAESHVETEIKLRWKDSEEAARRKIEQHGYQLMEPRTLETDQLFDCPDDELNRTGRLLRLRRSGARATVTFKGPPAAGQRYKSREEIEFDVSEPEAFERVLDRLGYGPGFRYQKYRTKFAVPGEPGLITIDATPIGVFLELEGTREWIDRTAKRLGFSPGEYVITSYASLYEQCRKSHESASENMVFEH